MKSKQQIFSLKKMYNNFTMAAVFVVTFCLAIFTVIQFIFMNNIYTISTKHNMKKTAEEIAKTFFSGSGYQTIIADFEAENNLYVEIYSPKDTLVYTTGSNQSVFEPEDTLSSSEALKPRIMKILSRTQNTDKSYFEVRQELFAKTQYIVYGNFFNDDTVIELYHPIEAIKENATTASWTTFALSLFALALISITAFTYANSFTKPIKKITESTKNLASSDSDEKCPSYKIKELNELSESINTLSSSLNKALADLKEKNIQLEKSIEKEYKLEKQRKSFVANVSHELKTPISIIQGYAEGMKYGIGCDNTEEFCDIIIDESEKMNNLVVRLMEFVHYGSGKYNLKISCFNLKDAITDCLNERMNQIEGAGIKLILDIADNCEAQADILLFTNVLNNYISNALSHIEEPNELIITVKENEKNFTVSVFNTGKQIPGCDIENIWQSFYRADKSHSRKEGRFGLGLSIVTAIQDLHEQKYGVNNLKDGVEFWFDVKKQN